MGFFTNILSGGKELKRQKLITQANAFVDKIKSDKKIPTVSTSLFLSDGEQALLEEGSQLYETRAVRKSSGGFGGIRIMKGVTVGRYSGVSESHQEWRVIDSGKIILTNKRVVFDGQKGNKVIPLNKILSVVVGLTDITLSIEDKAKDVAFDVPNGYVFGLLINLAKQIKDPTDLSGINLDVDFK